MKTRFLRMLAVLVFLTGTLATLPSSPVRAATTWIVVNTNDSGPGSLRVAVGNAVNGDSIVFEGVSGTIALLNPIDISTSITITGPGNTKLEVSGENAVRVFSISGENVSISGLTITQGYITDDGGAGIYHSKGTLTLEDMAIIRNQAVGSTPSGYGYGGGIYNYSGSLIITDSSLAYNTAQTDGGGIYSEFAAGLSLTNVVVDHNQAAAGSGGGLSIRGPSTGQTGLPVNLDQVSITNNSAGNAGGGLIADHSLSLSNSLIAGNTTTLEGDGGGGLHIYDGGGSNPAVTISVTNTTITDNSSASSGGAMGVYLWNAASSVTLNNVTTANNRNTTDYGSGGGISQGGTGAVKLENSILAGNSSNISTPSDCVGSLVSLDYNLIQSTNSCTITGATGHNITGADAQLDELADNGGPTLTRALLASSPAIDAANDLTCALSDQRGVPRAQGLHCDMGAYELVQHLLSVERAGTGSGVVTSNLGGINCGSTCSSYFPENTSVKLAAAGLDGSTFAGWSGGGCSDGGTCTVVMDADKTVTASFNAAIRTFLPLVLR